MVRVGQRNGGSGGRPEGWGYPPAGGPAGAGASRVQRASGFVRRHPKSSALGALLLVGAIATGTDGEKDETTASPPGSSTTPATSQSSAAKPSSSSSSSVSSASTSASPTSVPSTSSPDQTRTTTTAPGAVMAPSESSTHTPSHGPSPASSASQQSRSAPPAAPPGGTPPTDTSGSVHPGAFCSSEGAMGTSSKGTILTCKTAKDGRLRWKK